MASVIRRAAAASAVGRPAAPAGISTGIPVARRKSLQYLLVFVTLVLVINALIGERGLMETLRARDKHAEIVSAIERLRAENARLKEDVRRLGSDPATIESVARQELGLIKPGEILFIIRDAKPAAASERPAP